MTITPEALVAREVHYCVSYLVSTLASIGCEHELQEQAFELASPIDDWEEAAREAGWKSADLTAGAIINSEGVMIEASRGHEHDWEAACQMGDIEPYQREVFEHWIVSDWLADRLAEKGEKVDKDFAGMTIWARTTTGQGIASDGVIEAICAELNGKA